MKRSKGLASLTSMGEWGYHHEDGGSFTDLAFVHSLDGQLQSVDMDEEVFQSSEACMNMLQEPEESIVEQTVTEADLIRQANVRQIPSNSWLVTDRCYDNNLENSRKFSTGSFLACNSSTLGSLEGNDSGCRPTFGMKLKSPPANRRPRALCKPMPSCTQNISQTLPTADEPVSTSDLSSSSFPSSKPSQAVHPPKLEVVPETASTGSLFSLGGFPESSARGISAEEPVARLPSLCPSELLDDHSDLNSVLSDCPSMLDMSKFIGDIVNLASSNNPEDLAKYIIKKSNARWKAEEGARAIVPGASGSVSATPASTSTVTVMDEINRRSRSKGQLSEDFDKLSASRDSGISRESKACSGRKFDSESRRDESPVCGRGPERESLLRDRASSFSSLAEDDKNAIPEIYFQPTDRRSGAFFSPRQSIAVVPDVSFKHSGKMSSREKSEIILGPASGESGLQKTAAALSTSANSSTGEPSPIWVDSPIQVPSLFSIVSSQAAPSFGQQQLEPFDRSSSRAVSSSSLGTGGAFESDGSKVEGRGFDASKKDVCQCATPSRNAESAESENRGKCGTTETTTTKKDVTNKSSDSRILRDDRQNATTVERSANQNISKKASIHPRPSSSVSYLNSTVTGSSVTNTTTCSDQRQIATSSRPDQPIHRQHFEPPDQAAAQRRYFSHGLVPLMQLDDSVDVSSFGDSVINDPPRLFVQSSAPASTLPRVTRGSDAVSGSRQEAAVLSSLQPPQIDAGNCFPGTCCIGSTATDAFILTNPNHVQISVGVAVTSLAVEGNERDPSQYRPFRFNETFPVAPFSRHVVQMTFSPMVVGRHESEVAFKVVQPTCGLATRYKFSATCVMPEVEITCPDEKVLSIDFGAIPWGAHKVQPLKISNKSPFDVALRLLANTNHVDHPELSGERQDFFHFAAFDSDQTNAAVTLSQVHSLTLRPAAQGRDAGTATVMVLYQAPTTLSSQVLALSGSIHVELDSQFLDFRIQSVNLTGSAGRGRLRTNREEIVLRTTGSEQRAVSKLGILNTGSIMVNVTLEMRCLSRNFSIRPTPVMIEPTGTAEVEVCFDARGLQRGTTMSDLLYMRIEANGPRYELPITGEVDPSDLTSTAASSSGTLSSSKLAFYWPAGRDATHEVQKTVLFNGSSSDRLRLTLEVRGSSDFKLVYSDGRKQRSTSSRVIIVDPRKEFPCEVVFSGQEESKFHSGKLLIKVQDSSKKFCIPLFGHGGTSKLAVKDAAQQQDGTYRVKSVLEGDGRSSSATIVVKNVGNRTAFVKAVVYSDLTGQSRVSDDRCSIQPDAFCLAADEEQKVLVMVQVPSVASTHLLNFYNGDEVNRQLHKSSLRFDAQTASGGILRSVDFIGPFHAEVDLTPEEKKASVAVTGTSSFYDAVRTTSVIVGASASDGTYGNRDDSAGAEGGATADDDTRRRPVGASAQQATDSAGTTQWISQINQLINQLRLPPQDRQQLDRVLQSAQQLVSQADEQQLPLTAGSNNHLRSYSPPIKDVPSSSARAKPLPPSCSSLTGTSAFKVPQVPSVGRAFPPPTTVSRFRKQVHPSALPAPVAGNASGVSEAGAPGRTDVIGVAGAPPRKADPPPPRSEVSECCIDYPLMTSESGLKLFALHFPAPTVVGQSRIATIRLKNSSGESVNWSINTFTPAFITHASHNRTSRAKSRTFAMSNVEGYLMASEENEVKVKFSPQEAGLYTQQCEFIVKTTPPVVCRLSVYAESHLPTSTN